MHVGLPTLPDDPQRRVIAATINGVRVINVYCVNGKGGKAAMYVLRLVAADDGDAVVGFLSAPNAVPAHHLQGGSRKFVLVELEFLQDEDIGLMVGKPVLHLRQAHVERIDVPSGDFHADSVCEGRLKSVSGFSGKIRTKQKRFMQNRFVG